MLDGMAGFVAEQSQTFGLRAAFDLEDLGPFEAPQARVDEVEGNRDAGNTGWREPFLGEPTMGSQA